MLPISEQIKNLETIIHTNNNQNKLSTEAKQILAKEIKRLKAKLAQQPAKL